MSKPKVLVIVGPTASGKTSLAIELAKQFNGGPPHPLFRSGYATHSVQQKSGCGGEVISADSRQVYKGLDIGSAKVSKEEMDGVPHHLLDVADPKEVYTAADFKRDAQTAMADILGRGKLPIVCGGTFFYVDALLERVSLPEVEPDPDLRADLEEKSAAELFALLNDLDPERAADIDRQNPRRLVRAIEIANSLGQVPKTSPKDAPYDVLMIGLNVDMKTHGEVVKKRLMDRFDSGLVKEVEGLLVVGVTHERLESFGLEYRYVSRYLRGELPYDAMVDELAIKIRQFAKRQMTWLKRDSSIKWFQPDDKELGNVVINFFKD